MPLTLLLRCNDLDSTRQFYRDTLGFTVVDSAQATLTVVLRPITRRPHPTWVGGGEVRED